MTRQARARALADESRRRGLRRTTPYFVTRATRLAPDQSGKEKTTPAHMGTDGVGGGRTPEPPGLSITPRHAGDV